MVFVKVVLVKNGKIFVKVVVEESLEEEDSDDESEEEVKVVMGFCM